MAPIGERTQRFFLGFLISTTFTSAVYSYSYFRYLKYHYNELVSIKYIKLTDKFSENLSIIVRAMIMHYKMVSGTGLAMFLVFLMLLFFTIQQMYYISKNVTQIELDKYEYEDRRRKQQVYDPVINIYDNGVFWNWMECLFPPSPHNKAD
ncbi:hypothetical protein TVAG_082240 [Trichomonas vaginalis G3]|uniref:Palmitoyltransferase n=1 Tax=Trichomonas vaginalis (strain ATCC PRA-98 / G3) TaxID=412133 RepID=A2FM50_TRIV3|nr:cysteine S-palmitoyltransferase protein [Trichomonas vaginalis G3]EAX94017.1 hypothetical protein TVAG_082240 [Trichomonas vaginalis G3]KAI5508153.1 cysteine S-palmitoyltransferase protein [Trichomonas vaginalis G3]|eukprot:XP_001306947.1 hypothetical protein [Trichomonas vaginalis G3]